MPMAMKRAVRSGGDSGGRAATASAAASAPGPLGSGVRRLVLTHFSQRYTSLEDFLAEASAGHGDVVVAEDLTRVAVPRRAGREER